MAFLKHSRRGCNTDSQALTTNQQSDNVHCSTWYTHTAVCSFSYRGVLGWDACGQTVCKHFMGLSYVLVNGSSFTFTGTWQWCKSFHLNLCKKANNYDYSFLKVQLNSRWLSPKPNHIWQRAFVGCQICLLLCFLFVSLLLSSYKGKNYQINHLKNACRSPPHVVWLRH